MKQLSQADLDYLISSHNINKDDFDLANQDDSFAVKDMSFLSIETVSFEFASFDSSELHHTYFKNVHFFNCSFIKSSLIRACFQDCEFTQCEFEGANLTGASINSSTFRSSTLHGTIFSQAVINDSMINDSIITDADLRGVEMSRSTIKSTSLAKSILGNNDFTCNAFWHVNLSGVRGLLDPGQWMRENFQTVEEGYIVYKAIGQTTYSAPSHWRIEKDAYLTEVCNTDPWQDCGCGVNFGTFEWVNKFYRLELLNGYVDMYRCLIEWPDLTGVVVPYETNGKARCSRLKILERIM